jgi:NAD(P)H-quinone oxidoreductase subunit 5
MPFPPVLLLLVPLAYLVAALLPERLFVRAPERRWTVSLATAAAAPLLALVAGVAVATGGAAVGHLPLGGGALGAMAPSVRLDALTVVMLLLITGIAAVILRFSRRYLDGEPGRPRYVRWFLATMACVSLLVVTNDLPVLALAWTGSSLALHQLLTFYGERAPALIAAHKKFLVSRVADLAIFAAVALIWRATGTLRIDALLAQAATLREVPAALQAAGLLLAVGVVLRSAQLPFHGWLIQVMEAPTPVSAFLHAGIVNIGGFVLIRLAGLVGHLEGAQTLLVVVGTTTAVLAALVMTTRVSVKVALAWSTCAQMGFMLLECGLGAYNLALLHLVAHSVYKAHAFLSSGRAVEQQMLRRMAPSAAPVAGREWVIAAAVAALVVAVPIVAMSGAALGPGTNDDAGLRAGALLLALALAPLFVRGAWRGASDGASESMGAALRGGGVAVALVAAYVAGHAVFGSIAPAVRGAPLADALRFGVVACAFLTLYAVQAAITVRPTGRFARALYPACFAGFYLDELCTRLTFRVWPPRALPVPSVVTAAPTPALRELPA